MLTSHMLFMNWFYVSKLKLKLNSEVFSFLQNLMDSGMLLQILLNWFFAKNILFFFLWLFVVCCWLSPAVYTRQMWLLKASMHAAYMMVVIIIVYCQANAQGKLNNIRGIKVTKTESCDSRLCILLFSIW